MNDRAKIVVLGVAGRMPFAGVGWQLLHYLEGFRRLGHDVYYVEDTGEWPYDPEANSVATDSNYTLKYIKGLMERCGLASRWAYRSAPENDRVFGLSDSQLRDLYS